MLSQEGESNCKSESYIKLRLKKNLPIYIGDGPEVFEHSLRQEVPDLRPNPLGFLHGGGQELLRLFVGMQLDELLFELRTETILLYSIPLE